MYTFRKHEMLFFLGSSTIVESQYVNKMQKIHINIELKIYNVNIQCKYNVKQKSL